MFAGRALTRRSTATLLLVASWALASPLLAETPEERLGRIRANAEQSEARAKSFAAEAKGILAQIEALDRQVVEFRRSRQQIQAGDQQFKAEVAALEVQSAATRRELETLRATLRRRLVALYKARATRRGPALYSAKDFQTGLRVVAALEQTLRADVDLFGEYRAKLAEIDVQRQRAVELASARTSLASAFRDQQEKERQALIQKKNQVDLLRTRAERERRTASELREAAARLEAQIRAGTADVGGVALVRGRVPWPVRGTVRVGFGRQVDTEFNTEIRRNGIEIDAPLDTPVRAVARGRVLYAGWLRGYGQMVIVDHGSGSVSVSGFLGELGVAADDTIEAGDVLGRVGETGSLRGPGLYFELRQSGTAVDPEKWLE
jgi:septal ring factor EnvC (AmiA/AmiB activator)